MDGVITDTMSFHCRAWHKIFHEEGIQITPHEIYKREGQKGIVSIREIFDQYDRPFSKKMAQNMLLKKERLFETIFRPRFIVGARSFVKMLFRRNIILALVTGSSRREINNVLSEKLLKCFSVIICGDDVILGKPHPYPYQKAIKAIRVPPDTVVVIENAPLGIKSAKAAGLTCFALETSLPKQYLKRADLVFHDFASLRNFIISRYKI